VVKVKVEMRKKLRLFENRLGAESLSEDLPPVFPLALLTPIFKGRSHEMRNKRQLEVGRSFDSTKTRPAGICVKWP
jgi:hypothetical protein